jgi:peptide/nickel transport system permease protein
MQRSEYLIRKVLFGLATLAVVITFNFFLFRVLPGDPVKSIVRSPRLSKEAREKLRVEFGLDKPVFLDTVRLGTGDVIGAFDTQFSAYVNALLHGNLGISFRSRRDVGEVLAERIWRTVVLVAAGEMLALIFGVVLGLIAAWKRGTRTDMSILLWALFCWGLPTFFLGIILLILAQGFLPTGGMATPGLKPEDGWTYWVDVGKHLILPTITMAIVYTSSYILITRSSVVEVLSEDYILTAKAKGMSTFRILRSDALQNAMLPMVTMVALNLAYIVGGAIQVETVFSWPGVGQLMYEAVMKRDYPVLQGTFLLLAVAVITANLAADILYSVLDPRVKVE